MNADQVRDVVLKILGQVAPEADPATIKPDVPFQEQLDIDSMDFLSFVSGIAQETGVEVPERDYPQIATLDGCLAYLARAAA
ncbi:MAG: acyl carrier protein [Actinomycetota bacterium]